MNLLSDEFVPRWYGLGWDPRLTAIHFRVNAVAARELTPIPANAPLVSDLIKTLKLLPFTGGGFGAIHFGFGGVVQIVHESDGTLEFVVRIPHSRNKKHIASVGASVALLLMLLEDPMVTGDTRPQLMSIYGMPSFLGWPIGGVFAGPFVGFLSSFPMGHFFNEGEEAMRRTYVRMTGGEQCKGQFQAKVCFEGGGIWLGNIFESTAIFRELDQLPNPGYELRPSTAVNSIEYLYLLAGLAALHDVADRRISPPR